MDVDGFFERKEQAVRQCRQMLQTGGREATETLRTRWLLHRVEDLALGVYAVLVAPLAVKRGYEEGALELGLFIEFVFANQKLVVNQFHYFEEEVILAHEVGVQRQRIVLVVHRNYTHLLDQLAQGLLSLPQVGTSVRTALARSKIKKVVVSHLEGLVGRRRRVLAVHAISRTSWATTF